MALTKIPSSLLDTSGGFDLQGNITLGDNEQIILGDSSDLQIYHGGTNSSILNTTGSLIIRNKADDFDIAIQTDDGSGNTTDYFRADGSTGEALLYYYGSEKLKTTSTGATVTGTLTVTGDLDITGNVNSYNVTDLDVTDQTITLGAGQTEANSGGSGIIIDGSSASILWNETDNVFDFNKDISLDNGLFFSEQDFYLYRSGADVATLRVGDSGSHKYFSFTDTGTVARFSSAAGAVSLGSGANDHLLINSSGLVMIGTSTPSGLLNVDGNLHYGGQLRVNDPSHDGTETNPSICVGYDNDNGFFRPASNTIAMTTAGTERMRITATGNVAIANTSTINAKLHIGSANATGDATNPALQIGGASTYRLGMFTTTEGGVIDNANGDDGLQFHTKNAGEAVRITADGNLQMIAQTSSFANPGFTYHTNNYLYCRGGSAGLILSDDSGANTIQISDSADYIRFETTDGSERMRIDSSGNLLVGKISPLTTTVGAEIRPNGFITSFRTSDAPALFARGTDDGDVVVFRKDSTTVGVIGTKNGDLFIGTTDVGLRFHDSGDNIRPANVDTGLVRDAAVDLGIPTGRFKDLYLSGGAYLGGTGSANYLDDYEEGTFSPNLSDGTNSVSLGTSYYRKIGSIVTVFISKYNTNFSALSATSLLRVTGLPFTTTSGINSHNSLATNTTSGYQVVSEIAGTTAFIYLNNGAVDYSSFTRNSGVGGASSFTFRTIMVYSTAS